MLLPAHVAGAYLATLAAFHVSSAADPGSPRSLRGPLIYGVVAGVLPDLDVIPFLLRVGVSGIGDRMGEHRGTFMHTPLCALMMGLLPLLLSVRPRRPWMVAGAVGVLSHLLLDSLTIGFGVMWLYPLSHELYGINLATRWYREAWRDEWLRHYVTHPLFLIEIAIVVAALVVAWTRRDRGRGRASDRH